MKMLKRWIAFCLVMILLAGVAFDHSSLIGSQVEAADLTEPEAEEQTAETVSEEPQAAGEGDTTESVSAEQQATGVEDTSGIVSEEQQSADSGETSGSVSTELQSAGVGDTSGSVSAESQTVAEDNAQAAAPEVKHQDALELKQEIKDADGTVICTVTANIEEGTFDANTEEVSMKVSTIEQTLTDEITDLAKEKLDSDKELGSMFLYKVEFQVNGTTAEPGKEVKLTFQPKDFQIDDTKKATVFYYNEANSPAGNTEAEIVEIIQKQEQIEALQAAGQSTGTVDEDYDLTEISLKEDGTAKKIVTEGRRSTVYGCYLVEDKPETSKADNASTEDEKTTEDEKADSDKTNKEELKSLNFENGKVTVTVTEVEAGAIPEGAELKVVPILEDDKDTADQYKDVEKQIRKKAEEDEKEIEGFLAYDITFVDKDGNEVEPNSEVKVTMEYKKPAIPTLKTTLEIQDKEVSVLHLEEDADGNVAQVVDMDEAGQLDEIKTGDYQQVEKVEMRTESFSVFTITWTYAESQSPFTITAHYVYLDENGESQNLEIDNDNITLSENETYDLTGLIKKVSGYTYLKTTVNNVNGPEITGLQTNKEKRNEYYATRTYYQVKYCQKNNSQYTDWLERIYTDYSTGSYWDGWNEGSLSGDVYFVYEEAEPGLTIQDDIINTGALEAVYIPDEDQKTVTSYEWLRSDSSDSGYISVDRIVLENGKANISESGSSLYPAFDRISDEENGARKWYQVKATLSDGSTLVSEPYQVPYYAQLQNGGFETPVVSSSFNQQYTNENYAAQGGVWQSTGVNSNKGNVAIEIVHEGRWGGDAQGSGYAWYNDWDNAAPEGEQFAELNCETAGALYQDVLTTEGTDLNYWLKHRARGKTKNENPEYDTMYLVIMPTSKAVENNLTTQSRLEKFLWTDCGFNVDQRYDQIGEEAKDVGNGVFVVRITSDDQTWHTVSGLGYEPTSSLTRFFFVAGDTDSGSDTMGNFLDEVGFDQKMPPVQDDEFTIVIEKNFDGLDDNGINQIKNKISFTIEAKKITGDGNKTILSSEQVSNLLGRSTNIIQGAEMKSRPDGSLYFPIANQKIGTNDKYEITITENNAELDGYSMESTVETTISVGNGNPSTVTDGTFELIGQTMATVSFTNIYDRSENKQVNFTKVWDDGDNAYSTRPESLEVTLVPTITVEEGGQLVDKKLTSAELGGVDLTRTITDKEEWKTSWNVPVYYNYNGAKLKINYSVEEGEIHSDYVYESSGLQIDTGEPYESKFDVGEIDQSDESVGNSVAQDKSLKTASVRMMSAPKDTGNKEIDLGAPSHNKYIEYDASTGEYTLNLDVTGEKGNATGADILFVIDTSGSMGSWPGTWNTDKDDYYDLLPTVKDLLTKKGGIIDKIFEAEGNVNSVAYVSFAGMDKTESSQWYNRYSDIDGLNGLKAKINSLDATGGTNWTSAMQKASDLMAEKSGSSNEKIVIFLSDGKPTYTIKYDWRGNPYEDGNGSSTKDSYYEDAAKVVNDSDSLSSAQFYSVYLHNDVRTGMETFSQKLNNSELVDGTNLNTALTTILNKVIPTYKGVTITDVLSDYVDFSETEPTITVTQKTADGQEIELQQDVDFSASVESKTVTVSLLNGQSLGDDITYTVSFKVKPSKKANEEYAEKGTYNANGDPGTGTTSANQPGFYSNDNEQTRLTYSIDGIEGTNTVTYAKPVIQVTTHTLTYTKIWNHPDVVDDPNEPVTIVVGYSDGKQQEITLQAPSYTYSETVPISKTVVSVEEKNINSDYTPSYDIAENGTAVTVTNNYSKATASTVTVIKQWNDQGYEDKRPESITVGLFQSENGGDSIQYDTVTLNNENGWKMVWENLPVSEGTGTEVTNYTHAVREIDTPTHYTSSVNYEYASDAITATITNTYDANCEDENYYIANVLQTDTIRLTKIWDDNNNSQDIRPNSLDITVNDGTTNTVFTLNDSGGNVWSRTVTVLERKNASYTATENLDENSYYKKISENSGCSDDLKWFSFTNQVQTKTITVRKVWNDGNLNDRPGSISVMLQRKSGAGEWENYRSITITTEDTNWSKTITGLPISYDYQVAEENVASGYNSTVKAEGDIFTITNTLKWGLKKTDMPEGSIDPIPLQGGIFALKDSSGTVIATGTSGDSGMVDWGDIDLSDLNGNYTLEETTAPDGYQKLSGTWTLEFTNGCLSNVQAGEGYEAYVTSSSDSENGFVITVKNDKLYELPSTGGRGIYWYLFGGVLLMMAASLIVYKNKRREVLKR